MDFTMDFTMDISFGGRCGTRTTAKDLITIEIIWTT
jgi:hypothetical protein